jgi:hypothetical protein
MAGLGLSLVVFVVLGLTIGVGDVTQILLQYASLVVAGFIAGRFAAGERVLHGSLAALILFVIAAAISLAATDPAPGALTLAIFGVVAALLGSAGGALAEWQATR